MSGLLRREKRQEEQKARLQNLLEHLSWHMVVPACPECGKTMVLRRGDWGPFFGCPDYPRCQAIVNIPRQTLIAAVQSQANPCPKCGATMVVRWGRKGPFLACPRYPDCCGTQPLC